MNALVNFANNASCGSFTMAENLTARELVGLPASQ